MPLLWNPLWIAPPNFRVWRGRLPLLVVGWQPGNFVEIGNPLIIQETPYGGFRFHVKLKDDFWTANQKFWHLQNIFEDVYVTFPFSSTPANAGDVYVRVGRANPEFKDALVLDMGSIFPTYYFTPTPELPDSYWAKDDVPWVRNPPYKYQPGV